MMDLATKKLEAGCDRWRRCSGRVDIAEHGTTFIIDLESAIRQAWREDLAAGPLRHMLTKLCIDFAPYVRRHQSFFTLLQEVPQFAVTFSQRAVGSIISSLRLPKPDHVMEPNPPFGDKNPSPLGLSIEPLDVESLRSPALRPAERAKSTATARRVRRRDLLSVFLSRVSVNAAQNPFRMLTESIAATHPIRSPYLSS